MRKPDLSIAVAESIKKMSVEEQTELTRRLSWRQLKKLETLKKGVTEEPDAYLRIDSDYIGLEIPPERIIEFLSMIKELFELKKVRIRFYQDKISKEIECSGRNFRKKLKSIEEILIEDSVIMESGLTTLYLNGDGCIMLESSMNGGLKKRMAERFLKAFGFSKKVKDEKVSYFIKNGKLKITRV